MEVIPVKVLGSTVAMATKHSLEAVETRQESLRVWRDAKAPVQQPFTVAASSLATGDTLSISDQARQAYKSSSPACVDPSISVDSDFFGLSPEDRLLISMLEKVLGIKIKFVKMSDVNPSPKSQSFLSSMQLQSPDKPSQPVRAGWGLSYDLTESYKESESLSFAAKGVVNTADGKQIGISIQISMYRQFATQSSVSVRAGDAKIVDPLVINYAGPAVDFTKDTFQFDIDANGTVEDVPFVASGSGFLVLDRNGDGVVNSGAELFGPSSGSGFAELAQFDSDGNGWIDSGDPVFKDLRIWTRDDSGKDVLVGLGDKDVGAIFLGNVGAAYSVKDDANRLQAQNTQMGIFIGESGRSGTVQQVDLAVGKR